MKSWLRIIIGSLIAGYGLYSGYSEIPLTWGIIPSLSEQILYKLNIGITIGLLVFGIWFAIHNQDVELSNENGGKS
jgi:hypothetical protein